MKCRKLATGFVALAIVSAGVSGPAIAQQPVLAPAAKKYTTLVLNQGVPKIDVLTTKVGQDIESVVIFSAPLTTKAGKSAGKIAGFLTDLEIGATGAETRFRNISFMLKGGQIIANGTGEYESTDREMPVERPSTIAIIGGTGKYIGAMGEVITRKNADGTFRHVLGLLK